MWRRLQGSLGLLRRGWAAATLGVRHCALFLAWLAVVQLGAHCAVRGHLHGNPGRRPDDRCVHPGRAASRPCVPVRVGCACQPRPWMLPVLDVESPEDQWPHAVELQFGVFCLQTLGPVPITVDPPADMSPSLLQMQKSPLFTLCFSSASPVFLLCLTCFSSASPLLLLCLFCSPSASPVFFLVFLLLLLRLSCVSSGSPLLLVCSCAFSASSQFLLCLSCFFSASPVLLLRVSCVSFAQQKKHRYYIVIAFLRGGLFSICLYCLFTAVVLCCIVCSLLFFLISAPGPRVSFSYLYHLSFLFV